MFKFNAVTIGNARAFYNTLKERELDLRGYKAIAIENMGITQDQFDTLDMSDNEIKKLENFPIFSRLRTLLLNNNHVRRVSPKIGKQLIELRHLVLTNNKIANFSEIDNIATLENLLELSLVDNPVVRRPNYRLYVIHKMPQLRLLDFRRVRSKEREDAKKLFSSEAGKLVKQKILEAKTAQSREQTKLRPTSAQLAALRAAVRNAKTADEIDHLERMARAGNFPSMPSSAKGSASEEVESSGMDVDETGEIPSEGSKVVDPEPPTKIRATDNSNVSSENEAKKEMSEAKSTKEAQVTRTRSRSSSSSKSAGRRTRTRSSSSASSEKMDIDSSSTTETKTRTRTRSSSSTASSSSTSKRVASTRRRRTRSNASEIDDTADVATTGTYEESELKKLRVVDLRKILKSRGMNTKGRKADLIGRLKGQPKAP